MDAAKFAGALAGALIGLVGCGAEAVELSDTFPGQEAIEHWADAYYFGGHELQTFERDDVSYVVVVGRRGAGQASSEISIYAKRREEPFRLALFLPTRPALLTVEESSDAIVIKFRDVVVSTFSFAGYRIRQPNTLPLVPR